MTRPVLHRLIRRQEQVLDASLDYLRDIADSSPAAFLKVALIAPLGTHRRFLPLDAWHVARVAATLVEDCGTCAQISITLARRDGIPAEILRSVVLGEPSALPEHLRDIRTFARTIAERRNDASLRRRLVQHFGQDGFVELALVITISRFIPSLKHALGRAQSCALLRFKASFAA